MTEDSFEVEPEAEPEKIQADWLQELPRDKHGALKNTFAVLCAILRRAPEYESLRYNDMTLSPELNGNPLPEAESGSIRERIELRYDISPTPQNLSQALLTVSSERRFHPIKEYLRSLEWDGKSRLDGVLERVLCAPPNELYSTMIRKWFISAVARGLTPGAKVDTALVLVGRQGRQKSTFFSVLGGSWFSDSPIDIRNKDSMLQLAASWVYEWGEIEQITNAREASEVKAVLSSRQDMFRPPYERGVRTIPRGCVLVGTTNQGQFLNDETGSRRFWVVPAPAQIDVALLRANRDQLWAEAVAALEAGENWWLADAEDKAREADAERYQQSSPWEDEIIAWLAANRKNPKIHPALKLGELMEQCLKIERKDLDSKGRAASKILKKLGFEARLARCSRGVGSELGRFWFWPDEPRWLASDSNKLDPEDGGEL